MKWLKWYPVEWINSTARDELEPEERATFIDFVCLASFPGYELGSFKIASWESLARKLNTPLEVVMSTRDKCAKTRITYRDDPEGIIVTVINWAKYQPIDKEGAKDKPDMPDPRVTKVAKMVERERGYPSPSYGEEAQAIKWMLVHEYTPEDIMGCYRHMRADKWWSGKLLSMSHVKKAIGERKKGPQEPPGLAGLPDVTA